MRWVLIVVLITSTVNCATIDNNSDNANPTSSESLPPRRDIEQPLISGVLCRRAIYTLVGATAIGVAVGGAVLGIPYLQFSAKVREAQKKIDSYSDTSKSLIQDFESEADLKHAFFHYVMGRLDVAKEFRDAQDPNRKTRRDSGFTLDWHDVTKIARAMCFKPGFPDELKKQLSQFYIPERIEKFKMVKNGDVDSKDFLTLRVQERERPIHWASSIVNTNFSFARESTIQYTPRQLGNFTGVSYWADPDELVRWEALGHVISEILIIESRTQPRDASLGRVYHSILERDAVYWRVADEYPWRVLNQKR